MSIYMVQHSFSRPDWEQEWNDWYAANLKVLLGVPGFQTAQRFKATAGNPPRYMAIYTVDSPEIFQSAPYVAAGGNGANSVRFRPAYQVWIRNLFEGMARAPIVAEGQFLVMIDSATGEETLQGIALHWLRSTGFHQSTPFRGIAAVTAAQAEALDRRSDVAIYQPIAGQYGQS